MIDSVLLEQSLPLRSEIVKVGEPKIVDTKLEESLEFVVAKIAFGEEFRDL